MNLKQIIIPIACAAALIPAVAFGQTSNLGKHPLATPAPVHRHHRRAHHHGGYVHAGIYVNKSGKVVHRHGYYRHAWKHAHKKHPK